MSKSNLPDGGYTLTHGSNYMMDGFQFDTEYGGGPLEKARLPEAKGLSVLPSGMIPSGNPTSSGLPDGVEIDTGMDLDELYKEGSQDISIVDHSWLASQPQEDLSGMLEMSELVDALEQGQVNSPDSEALLTLGQAWGEERTDGLNILPNQSRAVKPKAVKQGPASGLPQDLVKKARRKLAYGESIDTAMGELDALNTDDKMRVYSDMQSEYGLSGRVYVRESDFPGLFNGRWDEVVNRRCATSLYIISEHPDNIHDRFLGREVVASEFEIDWNKVARTLTPKLEASGVKIAGALGNREKVRKAFTDLMEGKVEAIGGASSWYTMEQDPSDLISLDRARRSLAEAEEEVFHINTVDEVHLHKLAQRVERVSKDLVKEGFLDQEQAEAVVASENLDPQGKLDRLYQISVRPKQAGEYKGVGTEVTLHTPKKGVSLNALSLEKRKSLAQAKVARLVKAGLITVEEAQQVSKGARTPEQKLEAILNKAASKSAGYKTSKYAGAVLNQDSRMSVAELSEIQQSFLVKQNERTASEYQTKITGQINRLIEAGLISEDKVQTIISDYPDLESRLAALSKEIEYRPAQKAEEGVFHVLGQKKASERVASEEKVATWLRQKMSEGMAGQELDQVMKARFSSEVLSAYKTKIGSIRKAHEGLSGHAYVDAETYMTEGMEGCDKGALIHRANQIPTVLKTARCGGCVFSSQGRCQKYAKTLIASVDEVVENKGYYQKEMIRLANASDSERTASLFVNDYDQDEFNLVADGTVEIDNTEAPTEVLEDVLFGGFEV